MNISPTTRLDPVADTNHIAPPDPTAPPEWLLLAVRSVEDGRYLLLRRAGSTALTMPSTSLPHRTEGLTAAITSLVRTHLNLAVRGKPQVSTERRPVRALHPYTGGGRTGYLRAVAVEAAGEARPDVLFHGLEALPLTDAVGALATDLERLILQDGAKLLGDRV